MPDISMLIPLSEALDISVIELLKGEEIKEEYNENEIVQSIIDYTKIKPNRIKYDFWSKFIICLVCIITLFVGIDYIKYKPHQWYNGDVSQWQEDFIGDAYEMAFSMKTNRVVFKYPFKALTQIKIECKDAIEYIQKEYHQLPLSKYNYAIYGNM